MEVTVPVNNNYFDEAPFSEEHLRKLFKTKGKKFEVQKDKLFSSVFELTTHNSNLKNLKLFGFKNQKGRQEDERLILKLYSKEQIGGGSSILYKLGYMLVSFTTRVVSLISIQGMEMRFSGEC